MRPGVDRDLLGLLLTSSADTLRALTVEPGLKPEHFPYERDQATFRAMIALADRGVEFPDPLLVADELGADDQVRNLLLEMAETHSVPHANAVPMAESVIRQAEWRRLGVAADELTTAVKEGDRAKLAAAREELARDTVSRRTTATPKDLRDRLEQIFEGEAKGEFQFPFKELNRLTGGGLARQEHHAIAGHSSHGKSTWLDQLLRYWGGVYRVHLYTNEMNLDSRLIRQIMTEPGVTYTKIRQGQLSEDLKDRARKRGELNLVFGITDATGWTAREIANHIRLNRWDIAAVDILHNLAPEDGESTNEQTLTNGSRLLTEASRQADCLVISVSHLNEGRNMGTLKPKPTLGDIRGSGMIKNSADSVCFVWREQDTERGLPEPAGEVTLAKVRNGIPGFVKVRLDEDSLEFLEVDNVRFAPFGEAA